MNYRAIFISDVHLGTKMCQANKLLEFLKDNESEKLYLVGDIIDCWAMSKTIYWPQAHNDIVQKILRKARKGTDVIYISGNHDEVLRNFDDQFFGNVEIREKAVYISAQNKPILVIHGDQFDVVMKNAAWLAHFGSLAYDLSMNLNVAVNRIRRWFNLPYWSLSKWAKYKVKKAVNFMGKYEDQLSGYAKSEECAGIICGHIHHANIRVINDVEYMNCGDWCESCTALVEHYDGTWEIIRWGEPNVDIVPNSSP
jgi:UDP-2,3-diacylglucosamine pyrophosphatase LpxH